MNPRILAMSLALLAVVTAKSGAAPGTAPPESYAGPPLVGYEVMSVRPQYTPVQDLIELLGATRTQGIYRVSWEDENGENHVDIRPQETVNQLILTGNPAALRLVGDLIQAVDVPPRQIEIQARIIEVDKGSVSDLGIDWDGLWRASSTQGIFTFQKDQFIDKTRYETSAGSNSEVARETKDERRSLRVASIARLSDFVHILEESGAGRVRSTPRILTLNGRTATILDGQRVTYVTRVSSYTNIYETQTMDAGLKLQVMPTLGESGYLILDIQAELTGLTGQGVSGSPVKDGQIINNTVVLRDGETILLGGFERTSQRQAIKRFPVLGYILPFVFSREVKEEQMLQSVIVLSAHSVDLDAPLGDGVQRMIEGD